jgi:hypothetical protein
MSFCLSNVSEFWFIPSHIILHHHLYGILILKSTYFSQGGKRENLQIIGDKPIYIYYIQRDKPKLVIIARDKHLLFLL